MLGFMRTPIKTELSVEKVFQAEAQLLAYVQSGSCNPHQQRKLAKAAQSAIDESSGPLEKPFATRWKFRPVLRPTHN